MWRVRAALFFVLFFHRVLSAFASLCLEIDFRRVPLEELATFFYSLFILFFNKDEEAISPNYSLLVPLRRTNELMCFCGSH